MLQAGRFEGARTKPAKGPAVAVDDFPAGSLDEAQAKQLFARFGVPCARESHRHHAGRGRGGGARARRSRRAEDPLARSRTRATSAASP